ncbi:hypothetical protein [Bradyrhizobium sp. SZCCHNPS1003]|uniref:hypothetical protein n=1 Tax=Bradyrhizobium sp. SZCCHNPS1003 TaxID=3057330 RepID=UPI0028EB03D4|nr:hypothetical protein [Bradyrhizobium sp. SZCCHNPS1003]
MTGHYPAAYFALLYIGCWVTSIAALVTHVISCVKAASIALLIIGIILPPVGVIHGWGIWLGFWT